jgi:hypothetical protein
VHFNDLECTMTDLPQPGSFTINEWCGHRRISRGEFYKLKKIKKAPRLHYAGTKPLISREADADWVRDREAEFNELHGKAEAA